MAGLAAITDDGLPSVAQALLDAADLCEQRVGKAGTCLEGILNLALQHAGVVRDLLGELSGFDLRSALAREGAIREDHAESTRVSSSESRALVAEVEAAADRLARATRELRLCSETSRVLADQTLREVERLGDASLGSAAEPVTALNGQLAEVTGVMQRMLQGLRFVLTQLRAVEHVLENEGLALGDAVRDRLAEIEEITVDSGALLARFASDQERRTAELLQRTREGLTHLQFQDPICQELRDIARRVLAEDVDIDELGVLLARIERASGRFGSPLSYARASLREIGGHCDASARQSQAQMRRLFASDRDTMGDVVITVRRAVGLHVDRLQEAGVRKRALAARALGQCDALTSSEQAVRDVASQTTLVAANAAVKAAHVRGSGRATSVIASEMAGVDRRVAGASARMGTLAAHLIELLPRLSHQAETSSTAARQVGASVARVLEAAESRVCEAESALSQTLSQDPQIAREVSELTNTAFTALQMEGELDTLLRSARCTLEDLGIVPGDLDEARLLDGGAADDHPVAAGELLLF